MKKKKFYIDKLIEKEPIASEEYNKDKYYLEVEGQKIIPWNNETLFSDLTNDKGVYVIYDYENHPVYVGKTWGEGGFSTRFYKHCTDRRKYFPYWELIAGKIRFYIMNNVDPIEILLLERMKIHHLNPQCNKDDGFDFTKSFKDNTKSLLDDVLGEIRLFKLYPDKSDNELRFLIVMLGYGNVRKELDKGTESFEQWFDNNSQRFEGVTSKSGNYLKGLRELAYVK